MWDLDKILTRGVLFEVEGRKYIKIDESSWFSDTHITTVTTAMDDELRIEDLDSYQQLEPKFFIKVSKMKGKE